MQILRSSQLETARANMEVRTREFSLPSVCTTFRVQKVFVGYYLALHFEFVSLFVNHYYSQASTDLKGP